jgi:hypothetical protein
MIMGRPGDQPTTARRVIDELKIWFLRNKRPRSTYRPEWLSIALNGRALHELLV